MTEKTVPPCQAACPIYTDVRGYVSAIARGDAEEAIRIIRQVNPLPSVCGRICTRLCEKACRRAQIDKPVSIRALKRFAADQTKNQELPERPQNSYNEKIAVVGSGPAGLTAAHDLALLGYKVTIYEARDVLGGLLSEGIPEYRLPKKLVKKEIDNILSLGVEAKTGSSLGKDLTLEGLLEDYQAVFLAVGSQKSMLPKCTGNDLSGVVSGVEFLKQVSRGQMPAVWNKVLVIGGGHTAIDAARTAIRLGSSDVSIIYRRTLDEMPAGREEVEEAEREGIKMIYLASPVAFTGEGKVQSVRFVRMRLGESDASGRQRPVPVEGSEFEIEADTVILAIGYTPDAEALEHAGLDVTKKGTVIVKDATGITNIKGVFAAGDVVTGPLSVIEAMASGRRTAEAIHRYLRNMPEKEVEYRSVIRSLDNSVVELIGKADRQAMPLLEIEKRVSSFEEVDLGYDLAQARTEALRCLNCGAGATVAETCAACLNCIRICPFGVPVPGKEVAEIDISQCQACGICAAECPASAIQLSFERKEDLRSELDQVIDFARQETPEFLIIGIYCRYASPVGPPFERDEVYWIGSFCTGRISESHLIYPFEMGADGVIVSICADNECRFRDGSRQMNAYSKRAKKILNETGIGAERLDIISEEDFSEFRKKVEALGVNPIRTGKKVKV
jgi:NADPH-dependent glutamate synthase beta subunit-like oxidoreductase/coenzyme F420-reducing hydrogenase delta subunit